MKLIEEDIFNRGHIIRHRIRSQYECKWSDQELRVLFPRTREDPHDGKVIRNIIYDHVWDLTTTYYDEIN